MTPVSRLSSRWCADVVFPRRRPVVVMAASLCRHRDGVLPAALSTQTGPHHGGSEPHEVAQPAAEPQGRVREHSGEILQFKNRTEMI